MGMGDALARLGHSQELLTFDAPDVPWVRNCRFPVHAFGRHEESRRGAIARLVRYLGGSGEAEGWLRANIGNYDGAIVNGLWNTSTRLSCAVLPGSKLPYVVFPHGMLDNWFGKLNPVKYLAKKLFFKMFDGRLITAARRIAFTTQTELRIASTNFPIDTDKCAVVGFGISPPPAQRAGFAGAFASAAPALDGREYLLFISRIHEKKGGDLLIEAFARLAGSAGHVDLVMAGPGESGYVCGLRAQAVNLGIADRVHWTGMLAGDAKWGAIYGCTAMVLPSHQENFGLVVVETMACGRPVLISDQVNIHDEVAAAAAGLIAPDTVNGTEAALKAFLALSPQERSAMGQRGTALFADRFEMVRTASKLVDILSEPANSDAE